MDFNSFVQNAQRLIDLTLRYAGPGGAAVLTFGLLQTPDQFKAFTAGPQKELSSWLLVLSIAVAGPLVHAVHRSLLHWLCQHVGFFAIRITQLTRGANAGSAFPPSLAETLDAVTRKRAADRTAHWIGTYQEWAGQIHFLYGVAWAILGAYALHLAIDAAAVRQYAMRIYVIVATLVLLAMVSDFRCLRYQLVQPETPPKPPVGERADG